MDAYVKMKESACQSSVEMSPLLIRARSPFAQIHPRDVLVGTATIYLKIGVRRWRVRFFVGRPALWGRFFASAGRPRSRILGSSPPLDNSPLTSLQL